MAIATTNPATGEVLETFDPMTDRQIEEHLARAEVGFEELRRTSYAQRADWLRAVADLLDDEADPTARMLTTEMGKTLAAARGEVAKCAHACRYFAEHAPGFLADEPVRRLSNPSTSPKPKCVAFAGPRRPLSGSER